MLPERKNRYLFFYLTTAEFRYAMAVGVAFTVNVTLVDFIAA